MTYTLFTANRNYSSWSLRPWLLMRALDIAFDDQKVLFEADNHASFLKFAPNAQVPCLHDGATIVWDSLAIMEYLAERHEGVWPDDPEKRTWARCAAAEMHGGFAPIRNQCPMNVGVRATLHAIDAPLQRNIDRIDALLGQGLQRFGGPWLAGERFSAVDAYYAPVAFRIRTFDLPMRQSVRDWTARIIAHPAMQDWERQALAEPHREIGHEQEIAATARVTRDDRA